MLMKELEALVTDLQGMQINETNQAASEARDDAIQRIQRVIVMENFRPKSLTTEHMKGGSLSYATQLRQDGFHMTAEEMALVDSGKRLEAVKQVLVRYRAFAGVTGGLLEAKRLVDAYYHYRSTGE